MTSTAPSQGTSPRPVLVGLPSPPGARVPPLEIQSPKKPAPPVPLSPIKIADLIPRGRRRALPHPRGFGPPQPYSSRVLAATWRHREAHLLRVLSTKNLDTIKDIFDRVCQTGKAGLSAVEFVDALFTLFSKMMFDAFDKQEFCVQILELFAAIDVNGDKTMEWEELLDYVVQTVTSTVDLDLPDNDADGANVWLQNDAAGYNYQPMSVTSQHSKLVPEKSDEKADNPSTTADLFDDVYDEIQHFEYEGHWHMLCFRVGSPNVEIHRWKNHAFEPGLQPILKLKHGSALYSHYVMAAKFIPEIGMIVTCSRQMENSAVCANFFAWSDGSLLHRRMLDYPSLAITYSGCNRSVCLFTATAGLMYLFDPISFALTHTITLPETLSVHAAVSLTPHGLDATIVGTNTGMIYVLQDRDWKMLPGSLVIAHACGVKGLAYSDKHRKLVSIGNRELLMAADEDANMVLLWDVNGWIERLKQMRRERNATLAQAAQQHLRVQKAEAEPPPVEEDFPGGSVVSANEQSQTSILSVAEEVLWPSKHEEPKLSEQRPKMLVGHNAPVLGVTLYDGAGSVPHLVSADCAGDVIVWNLVTGKQMQDLHMAPPSSFMEEREGTINTRESSQNTMTPQANTRRKSDDLAVQRRSVHDTKSRVNPLKTVFLDFDSVSNSIPSIDGGSPQKRAVFPFRPISTSDVARAAALLASIQHALSDKFHDIQLPSLTSSRAPSAVRKMLAVPPLSLNHLSKGKLRPLSHNATGRVRPPSHKARDYQKSVLKIISGTLDEDQLGMLQERDSKVRDRSRTIEKIFGINDADEEEEEPGTADSTKEASGPTTDRHIVETELGADMRAALALLIMHVAQSFKMSSTKERAVSPSNMNKLYSPPIHTQAAAQKVTEMDPAPPDRMFSETSDYEADKILGLGAVRKLPESAVSGLAIFPMSIPDSQETRLVLVLSGPSIPMGRAAALLQHGPETAVQLAAANGGKIAASGKNGKEIIYNVHFAPLGSPFYRHGIAAYSWTPAMPPREGISSAYFLSPTLGFATLSNSTLCIWDALTGRPLRTLGSKYVTQRATRHLGEDKTLGAPDILSMCLDDRQRKIIVGDVNGYIHVVNPLTGTVMKMLHPDPAALAEKDASRIEPDDEETEGEKGDPKGLGILEIKYTQGEVLCISGRGTMWASDESSLDGWDREQAVEDTLCRQYHLPRPLLLSRIEEDVKLPEHRHDGQSEGDLSEEEPLFSAPASGEASSTPAGSKALPPLEQAKFHVAEGLAAKPSHIAVSMRLNLAAVSCSMLLQETNTKDGPQATAFNGFGNTVLLYDYRRAQFVGALANHETAAHPTSPSMNTQSLRGFTSLPRFYFARNLLGFSVDKTPTDTNGNASRAAPDSSASNLLTFADYLLPQISCMQFLDPLPALLTGHDDGSVRIWAVPPASYPYTCRVIWHVPDAVSLLPPNLLGKVMERIEQVKIMPSIRSRAGKPGFPMRKASASVMMLEELGLGPDGTIDQTAEAVGAEAHVDEAAEKSGVHSRIPTASCAFAAGMAPAMTTGALGPEGHLQYCQSSPAPPPAPDTLERVASVITMKHKVVEPADRSTLLGGPPPNDATLHNSDGQTAADMLTQEGDTRSNVYPCADKDGMIIWIGDSDGEIHRYFLSSLALLTAGLNIVRPIHIDPAASVPDERVFSAGSLPHAKVLEALRWSQKFHVSRHAAILRTLPRSQIRAPFGVPVIQEVFPVKPSKTPEAPLRHAQSAFRRHEAKGDGLPQWPPGVCWEGSWRAHGNGDVHITVLQVVHDTGVHALMSAANDGLARVWDSASRLQGTLDPNPRFQPFRPETKHAALLLEADLMGDALFNPLQMIALDEDDDERPQEEFSATRSPRATNFRPKVKETRVIGPGVGSGLPFDKLSLSHLCVSRVYDQEDIWVHQGEYSATGCVNGVWQAHSPPLSLTSKDEQERFIGQALDVSVDVFGIEAALAASDAPVQVPESMRKMVQALAYHGLPAADGHETDEGGNTIKCITAGVISLMYIVQRQRRIAGLRYASTLSTAPGIGPVKWHLQWDLRGRYVKQCQSAREALALVSLSKLRLARGFTDRSFSQVAAIRKLNSSLTAQSHLPPLPRSYSNLMGRAVPLARPRRSLPGAVQSIRRLQTVTVAMQSSPVNQLRIPSLRRFFSDDSLRGSGSSPPTTAQDDGGLGSLSELDIVQVDTPPSDSRPVSRALSAFFATDGDPLHRRRQIDSILNELKDTDTALLSSRSPLNTSRREKNRSPQPSDDPIEKALEVLEEPEEAPPITSLVGTKSILVERLQKEGSKLADFYGKRTLLLEDARMLRRYKR